MKKPKSKRNSGPPQALDGIRVLDLSHSLAGASASMMLANFGAEVIKVEPPAGDPERSTEPQVHGQSATFYLFNRGKKSITADLTKKADQARILELVKQADVLIESSRPGTLAKVGLSYEALAKQNARLVYVAITGYGQAGPYANVAGHDINYIARGGAIDLLGAADGPPTLPGIPLAELAGGGMQAVVGALLALQARERTGTGQLVDVALLDGVLGMLSLSLATFAATNRRPQRSNERLSGQLACYNLYPARDGRWISVGALEPHYWENLCQAIERTDLTADQYAPGDRQSVLKAELTRIFQRKTTQEWMEIFEGKDCCVSPVQDVVEATRDEHLLDRESIVSIAHPEGGHHIHLGVFPKLSATPGRLGAHPPQLGEDNEEILEGKAPVQRAAVAVLRREAKADDLDSGSRRGGAGARRRSDGPGGSARRGVAAMVAKKETPSAPAPATAAKEKTAKAAPAAAETAAAIPAKPAAKSKKAKTPAPAAKAATKPAAKAAPPKKTAEKTAKTPKAAKATAPKSASKSKSPSKHEAAPAPAVQSTAKPAAKKASAKSATRSAAARSTAKAAKASPKAKRSR